MEPDPLNLESWQSGDAVHFDLLTILAAAASAVRDVGRPIRSDWVLIDFRTFAGIGGQPTIHVRVLEPTTANPHKEN